MSGGLRSARQETWKWVVAIDQAILLAVRRWESTMMTRLMRILTRMGDPAAWVVVGLALGAVAGPRYLWLLGTGAGLAVAGSQVLKRLFCRPRPSFGMGGFAVLAEIPDAFSFPSGHTAAAFGVAVALAGEGSGLALLTLVLAFGIAVSRIYLGAHYPLDVAAGVLVGAAAGLVARLLVDGFHLLVLLGYAGFTLVPFGFGA
ncbi:MAG TPA: phosphatase PAP2 family protein [Thermoanaerobaculia bacterium]|nr:phosphatase PAP2 family protein [Thermoanaerobaculia bacterium]